MSAPILQFSPHPSEILYGAMLRQYREDHRSKRDPLGRDACWRKKVKPLLSDVKNKDWHQVKDNREQIERFIAKHCMACGLCRDR